jgi:hypothetical protein
MFAVIWSHVMIRIDVLSQKTGGVYAYWAKTPDGKTVEGYSKEPLLDACRQLKSMGVEPARQVAMYWPGEKDWAIRCGVKWGAAHTIEERSVDSGLRVARYRAFLGPNAKRVETRR